jgi:hypothetical protein
LRHSRTPNRPNVASHFIINLGIFSLYVLSYALVTYFLSPIQFEIFPEITAFGSLIFLPSGAGLDEQTEHPELQDAELARV